MKQRRFAGHALRDRYILVSFETSCRWSRSFELTQALGFESLAALGLGLTAAQRDHGNLRWNREAHGRPSRPQTRVHIHRRFARVYEAARALPREAREVQALAEERHPELT